MKYLIIITFTLLSLLAGAALADTQAVNYPTATPTVTDTVLGIDDPSGTWAIKQFAVQSIIDLIEAAAETDPIVGAITGIVKADGAGNIAAAVAGTDYEAVDAAIMRTDNTSEITGLAVETSPAATDLFLLELALDGSKAKLSFDDLATAINPGAGYRIILDDTQVTITDDGAADGQVDIIVDGTTVLTATADGITMGPLAVTIGLTANNTYSSASLVTGFDAGETIAAWQMVYYDTTATELLLADADAAGEWPALGMAVAASTDGTALDYITSGTVRYDTWDWTPGAKLYLSDTPGGLTETAPSTSGDCVQPVAIAITADKILLQVDPVNGYYKAK